MIKNLKYALFASLIIFSACSTDEDEKSEPLEAKFNVTVDGEAPNATLTIVNESTGASSYEWIFGEGSSENSSSIEVPKNISVDKAGELKITLKAIAGNDASTTEKTISIAGNSAIEEITDLEFSQLVGSSDLGRFYSFSENKMYLDSEIDAENGKFIDLFYKGFEGSFIFFEDPKDNFDDINVPNAKTTKVNNYQSGFEVSVFDQMNSDEFLADLAVEDDGDVIGSLDFPLIVTFETQEGKKGAIKLKAINSTRLLVDIKIQKY